MGGNHVTDDISESINRSADGMISFHGHNAIAQARMVEARMASKNDREGEPMWQAIALAIESSSAPLGRRPEHQPALGQALRRN